MGPVVTVVPADGEQPLSATTRRWGWGAAALTAIALSLLAVWAMGERTNGKHSGSEQADSSVADETQSS
jgi:hypothetical protein